MNRYQSKDSPRWKHLPPEMTEEKVQRASGRDVIGAAEKVAAVCEESVPDRKRPVTARLSLALAFVLENCFD
ncbi:hypothetical protein TNCV_1354051 [Trichonephila clavipes]|nr:hypothetical protein TNCV_1354051 [Trichonephila clavipes]